MILLFRRLHLGIIIFWIVLIFLLFLPFYYLCSRNSKYYGILNLFRKAHSYGALYLSGIFIKINYSSKFDKKQTYVFCSNHTSNLDIFICCILANAKFHFMGKEELLKNPLTALFFKTIDVTVNRKSKISSFKAFKKSAEKLKNGMSLIIFPEGKIGKHYPPRLEEFKSGPFRLAIENNIPIVPISITNVWKMMWDNGIKYGTRPGLLKLYVHEPIITTNLAVENEEELKKEIYIKIKSKLQYDH